MNIEKEYNVGKVEFGTKQYWVSRSGKNVIAKATGTWEIIENKMGGNYGVSTKYRFIPEGKPEEVYEVQYYGDSSATFKKIENNANI